MSIEFCYRERTNRGKFFNPAKFEDLNYEDDSAFLGPSGWRRFRWVIRVGQGMFLMLLDLTVIYQNC